MLIHDDLQIISFYVLSFNYNRKGYCSYYGTRIICIGTPPPSTWSIKKNTCPTVHLLSRWPIPMDIQGI